jgi:hypothetical protein
MVNGASQGFGLDPTTPGPDWYPDPDGSGRQRWWDGHAWAAQQQLVPGAATASPVVTSPGWYPDPEGKYPGLGYWDGSKFTGAWKPSPHNNQSQATSGWYPDPASPGFIRFWDGQAWGQSRPGVPLTPRRQTSLAVVLILLVLVGIFIALMSVNDSLQETEGYKTCVANDKVAAGGNPTGEIEDNIEKACHARYG